MTPEEQEAVRRALAAAPPVGPMPPEVVARLERTIADLAAERAAPEGAAPASVTELEQRRRRRWPRVLVAAASVAVLAYGAGAVLQDLGPRAETAASDSAGGAAEDGPVGGDTEGSTDGGAVAPQEAAPEPADRSVLVLAEATLRRDVQAYLSRPGKDRAATRDGIASLDTSGRYSRRDGSCALPEVERGDRVVAARLDGRRATLVVRRAESGTHVADVYWCGDGRTLLARTEVPARR